jgi:hypothetical protein
MRDGGWSRGLQGIMLSEKIANNDGHLKFLVSLFVLLMAVGIG